MKMDRRRFIGASVAAGAAMAAPAVASARPRVIVVGGGCGGATAARYIANDSRGAIEVVLIEPTRSYYTCFFGNLFVGGFWEFGDLAHGYGTLATRYGVNVVHDWVTAVDRDARNVRLASGGSLDYDRLVISPGIDFVEGSVPGWDLSVQNIMPHAYRGGHQFQLLKAQVEALPEGGTFALVAPPNPYRCPPGPYERVSMVAYRLARINPTAKILVIDPKETFSKRALFEEGWNRHTPGMVEWIGPDFGGDKVEVRPDTMEIVVDGLVEKVDAANIIPRQRAGQICAQADLVAESGWAPVMPDSMRSRMDESIFILGDSALQGDMPKSGFSANSQAKVTANVIRGELTGSRIFPARYANTCWSLLGTDDGVKVGASYEPADDKISTVSSFISQPGEDADTRRQTFLESLGWYEGITTDMFG